MLVIKFDVAINDALIEHKDRLLTPIYIPKRTFFAIPICLTAIVEVISMIAVIFLVARNILVGCHLICQR